MPAPEKFKTCYHCGEPATTAEHAPAKCLFPRLPGYRENLVTVPSCALHNTEKSGDDEHMLQALNLLASEDKMSGHGRDELIDRTSRSLIRAHDRKYEPSWQALVSKRFAPRIVCRMRSENGFTPEYLPAVSFRTDVIHHYLEGLARALFYKEKDRKSVV